MRLLLLNYETALGSAVHATPVLAALRRLRPDWEIHVACAGVTRALMRHHPAIRRIHPTFHPIHETSRAALQFVLLGLRCRFDAILLNTGNSRARIAWNGRLVRAGRRIGFSTDRRLVDVSLESDPNVSVAINNLGVLRPLIPEFEAGRFGEAFEVYFGGSEREKALQFRSGCGGIQSPLVGFVTRTSGGQPTEWRAERFVEVATAVRDRLGATVVFFGERRESAWIEGLCRRVGPGAISLAGKTRVEDLAAYCAVCDLLVTLDTGLMHVGRAVGVPMVVIAPAWQPAAEWLPLDQARSLVIRRWDIACRHCRKFVCETHECMEEITAGEVIQGILAQWARFPPDQGEWSSRLERHTAWVKDVGRPSDGVNTVLR